MSTATAAAFDPAPGLAHHHAQTLAHYTQDQQDAALRLFNAARTMLDTGGGSTCAKLLLGLYNGQRFPFDLTDLRRLDGTLHEAAMTVILMDSRHTWCEIHALLDAILAVQPNKSTGMSLELWAHRLRLKGRSKKEFLAHVEARAL